MTDREMTELEREAWGRRQRKLERFYMDERGMAEDNAKARAAADIKTMQAAHAQSR